MDLGEVGALLQLLDDPDEKVQTHIREKILSMGPGVVPYLEKAWENAFDAIMQSKLEKLIHSIQFENCNRALHIWYLTGCEDLLQGMLIVDKYQHPDLDEEKVKTAIEAISKDVWLELNEELSPLEKIQVLNHVFYEIHHFSGNTTDFHSPQNSFFHLVLETRKGSPLTLGVLYSIVAQSLNIPVYGVNLPEHFILGYQNNHETFSFLNEDLILFYINAFNKGSIFERKEIDSFLQQIKVEPNEYYFKVCSNQDIIIRLLNNLINSYKKLGYPEKMDELKVLLKTVSKKED
ncbi:MAG: transglutaminase-like domain-containing protein [Bacteroidota bacterium]